MPTLGDDYPREQERCRELIQVYRDLGPVGAFGAAAIEAVLRQADEAAVSGDAAAMVRAYEAMRGCQ